MLDKKDLPQIGSIVKELETETAHIVRNAVSERCKFNLHGHSYKWEIAITGEIKKTTGMVLDFKELADIKNAIDRFDHATVFWSEEDPNIITFFQKNFRRVLVMKKNVTAENMARFAHKCVSDWLGFRGHCEYVRVWETRTGSAIASDHDDDDILVSTYEGE